MKTLSATLFLSALLLSAGSAHAQTDDEMCAMAGVTTVSLCQPIGPTLDENLVIPVVVHVIADANGSGDVPLSVIEEQIEVLNDAFDETGFPEDRRFQFTLVGVGRIQNDEWHTMRFEPSNLNEDEGQAKRALNVDPLHVLNVYVADPRRPDVFEPYGWASYPFAYGLMDGQTIFYPEDHFMHGVVIDYNTLPDGSDQFYNAGDNAVHEVGHYLGLYHTYDFGCFENHGDCVTDTNRHRDPSGRFDCTDNPTCSGEPPPVDNFMNLSNDACRTNFSEGQFDRMDQITASYKPVLAQGSPAPLIIDERDGDEANPVKWTSEAFEGEDIYLLGKGAVTVPTGANVVLKADAQGNPTTLYVNGTLTGEENITLLDGSEIVCRFGSNCDMRAGLTASGVAGAGGGACILIREGGTARLGGTSVFSDEGLFVNNGGTVVLDEYARLTLTNDAGRFQATPGSVFRFGADASISIGGRAEIEGTSSAPVRFERADPSEPWGTLYLRGDGSTLEHVVLDGGYKNVEVAAKGVTLRHLTSRNGWRGLSTYYAASGGRSSLTVEHALIEDHASVGAVLYHADATIHDATVRGNAQAGLWLSNADVARLEGRGPS